MQAQQFPTAAIVIANPAAVEDAFAALQRVAAGMDGAAVDSSRIAVAGDSAGGNLSAVVAQMARDAGGPTIAFQALVYPAAGYLLDAAAQLWFHGHYLNDATDRDDWRASPHAPQIIQTYRRCWW